MVDLGWETHEKPITNATDPTTRIASSNTLQLKHRLCACNVLYTVLHASESSFVLVIATIFCAGNSGAFKLKFRVFLVFFKGWFSLLAPGDQDLI